MRKKRDRRELIGVFFFGIETQAGSGDALDAGDNSLAVGTVFEFDGQDALLVVIGEGVIFDETFIFENVSDSNLDFGTRDFNFVMKDRISIANAREHISNRISHCHREPISSFQLPTGFSNAGNSTGVREFSETNTAHFKLAEIAVGSAADFATIIFASGEFGNLTPLFD